MLNSSTAANPTAWLGREIPNTDLVIIAHLGASTFRARSGGLNREYFVRVIPAPAGDAWWHEVAVSSHVRSPHIAKVARVEEFDGHAAVISDWVPGVTLRRWVEARGTLDSCTASAVMLQMGRALHELHQRGFAHLSLSPDTVVLDTLPNGEVFARLIDLRRARDSQTQHAAVNQHPYNAPERREEHVVRYGLDFYSLAATMYYALTAAAPEAPAAPSNARPELAGRAIDDWIELLMRRADGDEWDLASMISELGSVELDEEFPCVPGTAQLLISHESSLVSTDGDRIIARGQDGVRVFAPEALQGRELSAIRSREGWFAWGTEDGLVGITSGEGSITRVVVEPPRRDSVLGVAWCAGSVIALMRSGRLYICSPDGTYRTTSLGENAICVAGATAAAVFAIVTDDAEVLVVALAERPRVLTRFHLSSRPQAVELTDDGYVVAVLEGGTLRLFETVNGHEMVARSNSEDFERLAALRFQGEQMVGIARSAQGRASLQWLGSENAAETWF